MLELAQLAEKDPEFYNYLQENDQELLEFRDEADDMSVDEDEEVSEGEDKENKLPTLTMAVLKQWQKALLEVCAYVLGVAYPTEATEIASLSSSTTTDVNCI